MYCDAADAADEAAVWIQMCTLIHGTLGTCMQTYTWIEIHTNIHTYNHTRTTTVRRFMFVPHIHTDTHIDIKALTLPEAGLTLFLSPSLSLSLPLSLTITTSFSCLRDTPKRAMIWLQRVMDTLQTGWKPNHFKVIRLGFHFFLVEPKQILFLQIFSIGYLNYLYCKVLN